MKTIASPNMWHRVFDLCVQGLDTSANVINIIWPGTKMDYVKINVILFCIILPIVLFVSLGLNILWLFGRL